MAVASAGPYASLHLAPDRWPRQHPTGCPSCCLFIAHWNTVAALTWAWPSHARWPPLCKYNQMQGRCLHEARHLLLAGRLVLVYTRRQVFEYHSSVQDMMTTTLLHSQCCTSIIISIWVFYDLSQHTRQTTLLDNATISKILYWLYRLTTSFYCNTHPLNGPFSGTTRVSQYQKGKTSQDFTEARDSEWQWHQHMQVCTSLQTDNHSSTPPLSFL